MRKLICTATIFAAILASLWAGVHFKHANTCWYWSGFDTPDMQVWIGFWLFMNFLEPVAIAFSAAWGVYGLWKLSGAICSKLQGEAKEE